MNQARALVRMARPLILPGGILAYCLGAAMGFAQGGAFHWGAAAASLLVTETANLVASYADEWADVDTDRLTRRTAFSGGSGVLPGGLVSPAWALGAALFFLVLSILLCAWFILSEILPWHCAWIVGVGLVGGWIYSMPPLALERRGLGELDNALLGGVLMPLMGYTAQTGAPSWKALAALGPVFLIVLVNLLGVHWADRHADAQVGKRSLVVVAGERVIVLHRSLVVLAYLLILGMVGSVLPWPVWGAQLLTMPVSAWAAITFGRRDSPVPSAMAMVAVLAAATLGWAFIGLMGGEINLGL